jgi:hypothetical protein
MTEIVSPAPGDALPITLLPTSWTNMLMTLPTPTPPLAWRPMRLPRILGSPISSTQPLGACRRSCHRVRPRTSRSARALVVDGIGHRCRTRVAFSCAGRSVVFKRATKNCTFRDFLPVGRGRSWPRLRLAAIHFIQWDTLIGLVEMTAASVSLRRSSLR